MAGTKHSKKWVILPILFCLIGMIVLLIMTRCFRSFRISRKLHKIYGEEFIVIDHWLGWQDRGYGVPPMLIEQALCAPKDDPSLVFWYGGGEEQNEYCYYRALLDRELSQEMEERLEGLFGDCSVIAGSYPYGGDLQSKADATPEHYLALDRKNGSSINYAVLVNTDVYQGTDYEKEHEELAKVFTEMDEAGANCYVMLYFMPEDMIEEYIRIDTYSRDKTEELAPLREGRWAACPYGTSENREFYVKERVDMQAENKGG